MGSLHGNEGSRLREDERDCRIMHPARGLRPPEDQGREKRFGGENSPRTRYGPGRVCHHARRDRGTPPGKFLVDRYPDSWQGLCSVESILYGPLCPGDSGAPEDGWSGFLGGGVHPGRDEEIERKGPGGGGGKGNDGYGQRSELSYDVEGGGSDTGSP